MTTSKGGRPKANIDWKKVDYLFETGCTGEDVACYFGLNARVLAKHIKKKFRTTMTEYRQSKVNRGDALLKASQYKHAVEDKNTTMLIWLGKTRLKQKEEHDVLQSVSINVVDYSKTDGITGDNPSI